MEDLGFRVKLSIEVLILGLEGQCNQPLAESTWLSPPENRGRLGWSCILEGSQILINCEITDRILKNRKKMILFEFNPRVLTI